MSPDLNAGDLVLLKCHLSDDAFEGENGSQNSTGSLEAFGPGVEPVWNMIAYTYAFIHDHTQTDIYMICIYQYIYSYKCMYICAHVYIYIYIYVYIYIYIYAHTYKLQ